ncbi:glucose-1-phosphate adenylyltransferase [Rhodoferax fermentans]|uniref:Glucose-1-phosphate adenylyltransferase n=1 Tax=Rhodoferax fermentans TaxID=28066 RepID=A0A1T1ANX3_RHOFE|nr:glucose-1-phosphate adenylyltransferase [Rhodoferax fermentans]MBK1684604.1 glucose-1-phosphate adenylyltransferase [Rhodoferax fermentans]OOV05618.1 glucose-1-phosphate adenylyltransferase [Rhodoferax fermentans]
MTFEPEQDERSGRRHEPRFVSQVTRNTFAMVLEGGHAGSLHELTDWRSKPALAFGGKFRIIDFVLSNCVNSGVRRVGVATQYRAQSLIRHLQLGWSFLDGRLGEFIEIMPAQQQLNESQWYRGSADAVFQNLREIRRAAPRYVLVLSGDHIYRMDYGRILAAHVERQADLTLACMPVPASEAQRFASLVLDDTQRVVGLGSPTEPPQGGESASVMVSMGIYVFNADFLYAQLQRDADDPNSSHNFCQDVIPHCVREHRVYAQNYADSRVGDLDKPAYWRDVHSLDAYWAANMDLVQVTPHLNLYDNEWPIWTWQPHSPPAKFVHDEPGRQGTALDSLVACGCIISGATVRRSMLFSDVRIHNHCLVEDAIILSNVQVGANCILKKCIIDKNCTVPEGTQIGLDPVEDAKRFHVTAGGVTLVTRMMLGQEVALF